MQVQVNTDNQVESGPELAGAIERRVREQLSRFAERLTRLEVHVRDVDGTSTGPVGIEVVLEARPAGQNPLAVKDSGPTPEQALSSALPKLTARLDSVFGKADRVR